MKRLFICLSVLLFILSGKSQNTSSYWSLAGNSNTSSTSSKLGTTNAIPVRFFTNNVERMRINATTGNIGIGTIAVPAARLQLNSAAGVNGLITQVNSATKLLVHSSGGVSVGSGSTPPANGLFVSGNTGIGLATPAHKLHVAGTSFLNGTVGIRAAPFVNYALNVHAASMNGIYINGPQGSGNLIHGISSSASYAGVYIDMRSPSNSSSAIIAFHDGNGSAISGQNSGNGSGVYGSGVNYAGVIAHGFNYHALYARVFDPVNYYAGYFEGAVFSSGGYYDASDARLKKNITDLDDALSIVNRLKPRNYEFSNDKNFSSMRFSAGKHYGLIAQEVEEVMPVLVKESKFRKNDDGRETVNIKAVNYNELIPVLVGAIQELYVKGEEQQKEIQSLLALLNDKTHDDLRGGSWMKQNVPNPVSVSTTIQYSIPSSARSARILFTNAKGKQLRMYNVSGSGSINFFTGTLPSGTYNYSLVVDGKTVSTKKLVVAH